MKKLLSSLIIFTILLAQMSANAAFSDISAYPWATSAINRLASEGIMQGMGGSVFDPARNTTRAEYTTTIVRLTGIKNLDDSEGFSDVPKDAYYYDAVCAAQSEGIITGRGDGKFYPNEPISRQDMFVITSRAISQINTSAANMALTYTDSDKISEYAKPYIANISEFIAGDEHGNINPTKNATRAEMAVFIDRIHTKITAESTPAPTPTPTATVKPTATPTPVKNTVFIRGTAAIAVEQAKAWAASNGASQKFIDIADNYWKYGELTGIRPDVLYAQSAKETKFGLFGGRVTEDMNNWAGIKTATASGDTKEDHETFATPDEGVRAHFNHMCAYVGLNPIGQPHERYYIVKGTSWAGTIKYVEELGGHWAPEVTYGQSIVTNYLTPMTVFRKPVDKSKKIVYLSPSNQYLNSYAFGGTSEGEQMNLVGALVKTELENRGFKVYMADPSLDFQSRANEAAECGAFAYVAIHSNAANKLATGAECWYRADDAESYSLAGCVYKKVDELTPTVGRGLKNGTATGFAEIRMPQMPNCLIEVDFHDVAYMAEWIINHKPQLAKAIADGIEDYWKK